MTDTAPVPVTARRPLGAIVIVFAILAAVYALAIAVIPPAVAPDRWSYPTTAVPFVAGQVLVGIHHFVMAAGLFAVWRIGLAGRSRLATVGAISSTVAMALFGILELVAASAADESLSSDLAGLLGTLYGVLTLVLAVASIVYGIAIIRARAWAGATRLTVLITGIYLIVPLIPAQFGPFLWRSIALIIWSLLYIGLGVGLRRGLRA